ncbi:helix-turn-helix transcriptional regulator [Nocardiopsis sp. NPDC049922]|uniref:helix-turn-helix domain-containing protein n=1 Tax=Nocardiopsis sp. NPDC049922 TaxID=3155157 RepID=UPI0033E1D663
MHTTSPPGWDAPALAAALQQLKDRDYTMTRLADLAQISRSQMSRWSSGGHRPGYDAVRALATALIDQHPTEEYRAIVRDLCAAAGYPGVAVDAGAGVPHSVEEMTNPHTGRMRRIVRSLEERAEEAGLSEEEERAMIERVLARAQEQAELMFDAELHRRDRGGDEDQA